MKRFIIAAVAAVVLASTPAAAQTTVGLGARFGPVVVSGHVGQAVHSHTDYVYGGSVRLKSFTVRGLYLNHEVADRKMYFQAGVQLPLKTIGG